MNRMMDNEDWDDLNENVWMLAILMLFGVGSMFGYYYFGS